MISVIIPIYNAKEYLKRAIDSVLNQDYEDFELILVNDGSTDHSLEICEEYEKADARVRVITKKNGGVSSARNLGIKEAKGEYITFLDADDFLENTALSKMNSIMEKGDVDIACFGYKLVSNNSQSAVLSGVNILISDHNDYFNYYNKIEVNAGFNTACAKVYKLSLIRKNNLFFVENISILEDISFVFRALRYSKNVIFDSSCIYNYYQSERESLVKSYNANFSYAIQKEYASSKWIVDYLDDSGKRSYYSKRFDKILAFLIKLYSQEGLKRKEKKEKLKECLKSQATKEILKGNEYRKKSFKNKIRLLAMRRRLYWLVIKTIKNKTKNKKEVLK